MPFPYLTKKEGRKKGGQKNKSQNGIIISIVPQCALFFWCLQWQELGESSALVAIYLFSLYATRVF